MAGTINLAFTQQFDMDGAPLSGGLLNFFTAGTTTRQSAFQDTGLTIVHPNPIVLDASGRVPMFYLADGFIKINLTDKNGVTIIAADQLLVIGPSAGGGGGGGGTPGDITQVLTTGDIKARYSTIVVDGFVRLNGLSIGNVGSSATERAEAVCQSLFVYLWAFPNITLDGFVKGADALTDWGAGRRLFLPDLRGRTIAGLDNMGNPTPANRLTSTYFGQSGIVLGNVGGAESQTLTLAQTPSHNHTGTPAGTIGAGSAHSHGITQNAHAHGLPGQPVQDGGVNYSFNDTGGVVPNRTVSQALPADSTDGALADISINSEALHTHPFTGSVLTTDSKGSGNAHPIASPAMVLTFYMKM